MGSANKTLWYHPHMAAKPVQISIDSELLERVDRDPEARAGGRSAFIRSAIELYLNAKRHRAVDERLANAYTDQAAVMADEVAELLDRQAWPSHD